MRILPVLDINVPVFNLLPLPALELFYAWCPSHPEHGNLSSLPPAECCRGRPRCSSPLSPSKRHLLLDPPIDKRHGQLLVFFSFFFFFALRSIDRTHVIQTRFQGTGIIKLSHGEWGNHELVQPRRRTCQSPCWDEARGSNFFDGSCSGSREMEEEAKVIWFLLAVAQIAVVSLSLAVGPLAWTQPNPLRPTALATGPQCRPSSPEREVPPSSAAKESCYS